MSIVSREEKIRITKHHLGKIHGAYRELMDLLNAVLDPVVAREGGDLWLSHSDQTDLLTDAMTKLTDLEESAKDLREYIEEIP